MPEVPLRPHAPSEASQERKAPSGRRGRRLGVEIKPGSVRQARKEAGLSLGQVAGDDISRTAIYFVETGKSKPSMETLRLIADRTGRPLEFFLGDPKQPAGGSAAAVAELERLLATGDNEGVVTAGERILERKLDGDIEAAVKHLTAMALNRLAQPVRARRLAAAARSHFERTGDQLMVAECLGTEANAAFLLQEQGAALATAEAALAALRTLKSAPATTEARLLTILAGAYTLQQNWQKAIELYEQAIEAGGVVLDLRRLSFMYGNLGWAYQELGQFGHAARYSLQALTIQETLKDRLSLARSENNLGLLLVRTGEFASARAHLDRALGLLDELGVEAGRSDVILSLSELSLAERRFAEAEDLARKALALAKGQSELPAVAEAHLWLGKIAATQGRDAVADSEFAAAIATLEEAGAKEPLRRVHVVYAEVLEQRGDLAGANRHLKAALAATGGASVTVPTSRSAIA